MSSGHQNIKVNKVHYGPTNAMQFYSCTFIVLLLPAPFNLSWSHIPGLQEYN